MVFAFLLQGIISRCKKLGLSHNLSVTLVFIAFITVCGTFIGVMVPIIWKQAVRFVNDLPRMFGDLQAFIQEVSVVQPLAPYLLNAMDMSSYSLAEQSLHCPLFYMACFILTFLNRLPNML